MQGKQGKQQVRSNKAISWKIVFLLLIISGINFLYMPAFRIGGDSTAVELVSVRLINSGSLSVPEAIASTYGDRGQFYFENILKNKWYSKYGLANTLIFAIPRYFEKIFIGKLQYQSKHRILFLNLFNIFLSMVLFYYLFQLSTLYTNKSWIKIVFCLSIFYCTYLSYYIRAQSAEIYQTLFFTGFFYHTVLVLRYAGTSRFKCFNLRLNPNLIPALIFLGLSCLVKIVYILMIPGFLFILFRNIASIKSIQQSNEKTGRASNDISDILVSLYFIIFLFILMAFINYYKFGSIFETGYGQWENEHGFSIENIPRHLAAFFFHSQNSIIINFPLIAFAAFGIKGYFKKYQEEALMIAVTVLPVYILIFSFDNWSGGWSYGPRYYLFALPVLVLPVLLVMKRITEWRQRAIKYVSIVMFASSLVFSAFLHSNVNALNFFIAYEIRYALLAGIENSDVKQYFEKRHFGLITYDLIRFRDNGEKLPFLSHLNDTRDAAKIKKIEGQILNSLAPNYY